GFLPVQCGFGTALMWSCGTSSDIMNGPFETSDLTADGSTAPHLSDPYLSMTSLRTGAATSSEAIHLKYGAGCWSVTTNVLSSGALRPRPSRKAGILAASFLGSRLA